MSERPTTATIDPASPEQGAASVADQVGAQLKDLDAPVAPAEGTSTETAESQAPAEKPAVQYSPEQRAESMKTLPAQLDTYQVLLQTLPAEGKAFASVDDFSTLTNAVSAKLEAGEAKNSSLTESDTAVFDYMKSEVWATENAKTVDMDAFSRPTPAFPENPILAKTQYIIDDLTTALQSAADEQTKKHIETEINHLKAFAEVHNLGDSMDKYKGDAKNYLALANNQNTDPEALKNAKTSLQNLYGINIGLGEAYKVIARYYPSNTEKPAMISITGQQKTDELYERFDDEFKALYIASRVEKSSVQDLKKYRGRVAETIADRENSKLPYGSRYGDIHQSNGVFQQRYSNTVYELFTSKNITAPADSDERKELMFTHILDEARKLEKKVDQYRINKIRDEDDSIIPLIKEVIEWARNEPADEYTEKELFDEIQSSVFEGFEDIIQNERTWRIQGVMGKIALGGRIGASVLPRANGFMQDAISSSISRLRKNRKQSKAERKAAKQAADKKPDAQKPSKAENDAANAATAATSAATATGTAANSAA